MRAPRIAQEESGPLSHSIKEDLMFANQAARRALLALSIAAPAVGCSATNSVRYVYQDHESGVVALSQLNPRSMAHATALMEKQFPNKNYEIVRSVEIEEGDRTVFESDQTKASFSPTLNPRHNLLQGLGITGLGAGQASHDRDREHADRVKIKETRIVYRRANPNIPASNPYASNVAYHPEYYVDHVPDMLRARFNGTKLASAAAKDPAIETASTTDPIPLPASPNPFPSKSKK
jgi:hypothetical protein